MKVIILNGPMGVGKTTIGKRTADRIPGAAFIDGDWCMAIHPFFGNQESRSMAVDNMKELGNVPYRTGDQTFSRIADYLYAAALTYDRLAKEFYPHYQNRSDHFFAIWDCYEASRQSVR